VRKPSLNQALYPGERTVTGVMSSSRRRTKCGSPPSVPGVRLDSPLPIKNDDADCAARVGFQSTGEPVIAP
jgi:hypothetical protein